MTQAELLADLLKEHYEHARLHEEHRATCTNFVMAIAAGLLAVASQCLSKPGIAMFFGILTIAVGSLGVLFARKHFERYRYHLEVAKVLRDELESLIRDGNLPVQQYEKLLRTARERHDHANVFGIHQSEQISKEAQNGSLKRLRLFRLYLWINASVIFAGVLFMVFARSYREPAAGSTPAPVAITPQTSFAPAMGQFDLVSKLWDLANGITGFAVIQGLTLAVAFGTDTGLRKAINDARDSDKMRRHIAWAIFAGAVVYIVAVCGCHLWFRECRTLLVGLVTAFQILVIAAFQAFVLLPVVMGMTKFKDHWACPKTPQ